VFCKGFARSISKEMCRYYSINLVESRVTFDARNLLARNFSKSARNIAIFIVMSRHIEWSIRSLAYDFCGMLPILFVLLAWYIRCISGGPCHCGRRDGTVLLTWYHFCSSSVPYREFARMCLEAWRKSPTSHKFRNLFRINRKRDHSRGSRYISQARYVMFTINRSHV